MDNFALFLSMTIIVWRCLFLIESTDDVKWSRLQNCRCKSILSSLSDYQSLSMISSQHFFDQLVDFFHFWLIHQKSFRKIWWRIMNWFRVSYLYRFYRIFRQILTNDSIAWVCLRWFSPCSEYRRSIQQIICQQNTISKVSLDNNQKTINSSRGSTSKSSTANV